MFKIATLADWFGVGLIEGIRESERCGAEGVQVYAAGEFDPMNITSDMIKRVRDTARACRQAVTALCGELGGYGLQIAEDNPKRIAYIKRAVDLAMELDCPVITTHIGVVPEDKANPRYAVLKEACSEIGEYAYTHGCTMAVETGPEKISTLRALLDESGGKGLGINYDPANLVMIQADDEVQGVYAAGDMIVHTHAKDGRNYNPIDPVEFYEAFAKYGLDWEEGSHYCVETPLGEGSVRWVEYLRALRDVGYDGFLTIEREIKNGADDIRMAVGFLREVMQKM